MEFVIGMEFIYLNEEEIIQFNKDLISKRINMSSSADNSSLSTLVSQEVKKTVKRIIGPLFENNIIKTLEIEYNWKISDITRHFFYREVIFKRKSYIIYQNQNVVGKNFIFKFDPETQNCLIVNKNDNTIIKEITEKEDCLNLMINKKIFNISQPKIIEIDALFKDSKFEISSFSLDEIEILFNNVLLIRI